MKAFLLVGLIACLVMPAASGAEQDEEARLIGVIQSTSLAKEKEDACRRLKRIGTIKSIPALATLLADEHLYQSACDALETMPFNEATEALRTALKTSSGNARAGVIHALGERRDKAAVTDLAGLLRDSEAVVAASAVRALGEIGGAEAVRALRDARQIALVRNAAVDALLRCASQMAVDGDRRGAREIFQELDDPKENEHIRAAAYAGQIRTADDRGLALIISGIEGRDPARQIVALKLAGKVADPNATGAFTNLLMKSTSATQAALLGLLEQRGDATAAPAAITLVQSEDGYVRVAAISALGVLGDATAVSLLASAAVSRDETEQRAARQALINLRPGNTGEAMVARLTSASPNVQAELARALAGRAEKSAVPSLLRLAHSESETTRKAAVRALSLLADGSHLAALVRLMSDVSGEPAREDVRGVFESIVDRAEGRKTFDVSPLVVGLSTTSRETRVALLQASALFADERLRAAFRGSLKDSDPKVRDAAARAMCASRDVELLPDLLELARNATELNLRMLALEGYVRLVRDEASGFPVARRAELLKPAFELATRPAEKRLVLSALTTAPNRDTLQLAERALTDSAVKSEAEIACAQIAKALIVSDSDIAEALLQRLATDGSATARTNAQALLKQLDSGWLCAGPYRQAGKTCQELFDIAFPPEEAGGQAKWRRAPGSPELARAGEVVLDGIAGGDHCVVYLKTRVFVPTAQGVRLEIGSDDGIKLWVNGELVHSNNAVRGLTPGQDRAKASLREGWNDLFAKVTQHTAGCGMMLRFAGTGGKAVPGLRFGSPPASP